MRAFWTAATELDPGARDLTEDRRFRFCTGWGLADLAHRAGFSHVKTMKIEAPTRFQNFDDFWHPFTLGAGPAPGYFVNLKTTEREKLREKLRQGLPTAEDGSITLNKRAWAIRGRKR
ncbi:hypothetical protein [Neorhizobium galegae]|uniref:hypothetical protein n=1 Tax=Neorhizobium galegae TaxID=399 RepID=UPI0020350881|nr:hypothetical protein [Neorhizobium galegae]MCM2500581.1 hypothetical protein [Neorhizobium galegae]MCQ1769949.1 hypothetical protein [Neorhizobium galegae]MCQ1800113.1 hypothetical protein [Neorhizobium galegae]